MEVRIIGKNIEITEAIKQNIQESLNKLDKYFVDKQLKANVVVRTYNVGQKIEITIPIDKNHTIHQEYTSDDLYEAISQASKRIERQIRKIKDRIIEKNQKKELISIFQDKTKEKELVKITKRKTLDDKLMTEEEAILQFELSGHDFFIFDDANSECTKVLYKRKNKEYGIIELD